ncbi:MAG: hypothetical protein PHF56_11745 [Desulfuromonadaceae bacterium]|nr:hypothetical protein [Desulfuromonadaceae bacterium]
MPEKHSLTPFLLICLIAFAVGLPTDRIGRTVLIIAGITAPTTS